jgi:carbonic anhydrase
LKVKHIIVCGHYGCGGVQAVHRKQELGMIDNWLIHIKDIQEKHSILLKGLPPGEPEIDRLCELNVLEQVHNVCSTTIVRAAWARGQKLSVHGWIYRITEGLIRDLHMCVTKQDEVDKLYQTALGDL